MTGDFEKVYKGPVGSFKIPDEYLDKHVEIFIRTSGPQVDDIKRARIPCSEATRDRIREQKDNLGMTYDAWLNRAADIMQKVNGGTN